MTTIENAKDDVKQQIAKIARKHFARDGVSAASLKSIAEEAGVAGSLINYHFHDRDGLFKACTELFAKEKLEAINRLLTEAKSKEEFRIRLEMFVNEMLLSHLQDPDGFEIIHREVKANNPQVLELFKGTMLQAFMNVGQFFAQAQKKKIVRPKLDPTILAMLFFSATCDTARNDHLSQRFLGESIADPERRRKVSEHIVDLFMQGVAT